MSPLFCSRAITQATDNGPYCSVPGAIWGWERVSQKWALGRGIESRTSPSSKPDQSLVHHLTCNILCFLELKKSCFYHVFQPLPTFLMSSFTFLILMHVLLLKIKTKLTIQTPRIFSAGIIPNTLPLFVDRLIRTVQCDQSKTAQTSHGIPNAIRQKTRCFPVNRFQLHNYYAFHSPFCTPGL